MSFRKAIIVFFLALCGQTASAGQPSPPVPHCFNAREVREAQQSDDRTLALRLNDESRYRLELTDACPDVLWSERPKLVSRQGQVCGSHEEYIDTDGRRCAVAASVRIDAREYADHALRARRYASSNGRNVLETLVVQGERRRRFGGTTAYCLDARHMRGWREDGSHVVVEMSPRRSGGNRYYRVELVGQCTEMITTQTLRLESPTGGNAICGVPGDRAVFGHGQATPPEARVSRLFSESSLAASQGCAISRVYPLLPDDAGNL